MYRSNSGEHAAHAAQCQRLPQLLVWPVVLPCGSKRGVVVIHVVVDRLGGGGFAEVVGNGIGREVLAGKNATDLRHRIRMTDTTVARRHNYFTAQAGKMTAGVTHHTVTAMLKRPRLAPIADDAVDLQRGWEWE